MEIKHRDHLWKLLPSDAVTVEVGVASGFFSRDILNWKLGKHYAVDAWTTLNQKGDGGYEQSWHDDNYQSTKNLTSPFGSRCEIIRGMSVEVAERFKDESIDFIHFDGDHSYAGVIADLYAWYPKIKCGGIISGHDYLAPHYGVNRAVTEFAGRNNIKEVFTMPEHKPEDAGFYFYKVC